MALLLEWPTFVLTIFSAVFIGIYFYFTRNFNFWKKLGVPYAKPLPFVGNLKECVLMKVTIGNLLKKLYDDHSDKPYVGIFSFDKPSLLVRDPDLLKNILVKDSKFFADHIMSVDVKSDPVFGNGLFMMKGQRWRQVRVNMTPVFTSGKLKNMFYLVVLGCKDLIELLDKEAAKGSPVDVKETMTRYTTDVIASCAFGIQSNTLKNPYSEFRDHLREIFDFTVRKGLTNLLAFFAPSVKSILRMKFLDNSSADYIRKLVWSTVEYREKTGLVGKDILHWINELRTNGKKTVQDAMVSAENPKSDSKFQLDDDEFVAQAFQILAGGFETSGTTMTFALYELARHPDIQHRLREEITRVMAKHEGELTYDGIQEMSYLDMVVSGSPVDVAETMARYTTDVIASCAFGIQSNSLKDPDAEFRRYLRKILDFSVKKGLVSLIWFVAPSFNTILKLKFLDDRTTDYIRNTVWSTVEYREKTGTVRKDFLDSMIELRNRSKQDVQDDEISTKNQKNKPKFVDGDDFVAQAFAFLIAGYETSGTTMSFALYELARHPDIQHRLREEITRVMAKHQGELTYDGIQEMSYLDMVVSETLRKYPVLPFLDRMCNTDYKLPSASGYGTVLLPKGTGVFIPVLALHHDPQYHPDPDKFDPERFTEENKRNRPTYTYLPFGEGPRICIGMRFGLMQVKAGLIHILSRFEVSPCKDTPLAIVFDTKSILLKMDGEIPLSFSRIHL